jgi:hypothetical protein
VLLPNTLDAARRTTEGGMMSYYNIFVRELNSLEIGLLLWLAAFSLLAFYIFYVELHRSWLNWKKWREEQRMMRVMTNMEAFALFARALDSKPSGDGSTIGVPSKITARQKAKFLSEAMK